MHNEKLKPENLTASARSPVIPNISETEKAEIAKKREEIVKERKKRKLDRLQYEKAEAEKAKAGGEQPEAEEPKKREPKGLAPKKQPKAKKPDLTFPTTVRVNAYGFVGIRKALLAALDWHKSMTLSVVKNPDGSVTIKKA